MYVEVAWQYRTWEETLLGSTFVRRKLEEEAEG
jgi:hypothetical protein